MSEKSYHSDCAICKNYKKFEMPSDIMEAAKKGKLALFCGLGLVQKVRMCYQNLFI